MSRTGQTGAENSPTSSVWRNVVTGLAAGALGGLTFSGFESTYVLATGEHIPLVIPLSVTGATILAAALVGMLLGLVVSGLERFFSSQTREDELPAPHAMDTSARRPGEWRLLVVLAGLGFWAFLMALPELAPIKERLEVLYWLGTAAVGAAAAYFFFLPPGRLFRSPATAGRQTLVGTAMCALVVTADLNSRLLPDALSLTSLAVDLLAAVLVIALLFLSDRLMTRLASSPRPSLRLLGFLILPGLAWLAFSVAAIATRPSDYQTHVTGPLQSAPKETRGRNPDVIMLILDTTRRDALTPFGADEDQSPALEAIARQSVVYQRAIAPTSWTLPSVATLMTGLYPPQHGAHRSRPTPPAEAARTPPSSRVLIHDDLDPCRPLRSDVDTLATWLKAAGYRTGAVLANSGYLHTDFGFARGFDHYNARSRLTIRRRPVALPMLELFEKGATTRLTRWCRTADDILGESLAWIDDQGDSPIFLLVNLMEAHDPYAPPPPFNRLPGRVPGLADPFYPVIRGERPITPEESAHLRAGYDGAIRFMDLEIGRFADALRARGRWDETLVVIVGDHGEMFGRHGMLRHGMEVWEELIRVPLMVHYPGGRPRGEIKDWVHLVDVAPTILAYALEGGRAAPDAGPAHDKIEGSEIAKGLPGQLLPLAALEGGAQRHQPGPDNASGVDAAGPATNSGSTDSATNPASIDSVLANSLLIDALSTKPTSTNPSSTNPASTNPASTSAVSAISISAQQVVDTDAGRAPVSTSPIRPLLAEVLPAANWAALVGERWVKRWSCIYQKNLKYCESSRGEQRLFDLDGDPGEDRNLANLYPPLAASLKESLREAREQAASHPAGRSDQEGNHGHPPELSSSAIEQLRALGYVR